ncbi:hypothetical protein JD844_002516 [Phrynosoma platyrhinos]|uniref:Palmitoyltransferase n=1 Tax=Phrynosoma platyrhinos TaxID=52577 RepID=A0ABQ7TBK9_PHRPL|nr:hypothetical protein JD844_002516 [Phrynosoma platyrhinos]
MTCYDKRLRQTGPERLNDHRVVPLYSRVNGWSLPLHSFQLITLLLYSYLAIVGFSIYIPLLPNEWKYVAYIMIGIIFVHHLITHLVAVTIDPADQNILAKKNYNKPMPSFDRSKCKHVIQNHHCSLCETDVFFFNAIASAVVGILLMILVILYFFIQYFVNPAQLRTSPQFESIVQCEHCVSGNSTWLAFLPLAPVETTAAGILTLAALTMILGSASLLLLGHLLLFHLYLLSKKMNTYEYMIQHQPKQCTISQDMSTEATSDTTCRMEPLQISERLHSTPADKEEKKLDSIDKKFYSFATLICKISNYLACMEANLQLVGESDSLSQ